MLGGSRVCLRSRVILFVLSLLYLLDCSCYVVWLLVSSFICGRWVCKG